MLTFSQNTFLFLFIFIFIFTTMDAGNQRARDALEQLLADSGQRSREINAITTYLEARPPWANPTPLLPVDEYEQRIRALINIRNKQRKFRDDQTWTFTALEFSMTFNLPLSTLEGTDISTGHWCAMLGQFGSLISFCKFPSW